MGRITVKLGDITKEAVAVIVNAANERLAGGGGVDGAIHRAAGPTVMDQCRKIGRCPTGKSIITDAGDLPADRIIHTVGPVWKGGSANESVLLQNCYRNSLTLAKENGLCTIAFPAISTGVYGYPIRPAAEIALKSSLEFINYFDEIVYVCYSEEDYRIYIEIGKGLGLLQA